MRRSTHDYEAATFIVRLWREPQVTSGEDTPWRGTAVHVQSGTERGVQGMAELLNFMQTWMQTDLPGPENGQ